MAVENQAVNSQHLWSTLILLCISLSTVFLYNLYKARRRFIKLKRQGLPMPPHHPLFGHLLLAKDLSSRLPHDAHPSYLPWLIRRAAPDIGPVFYLDLWPVTIPLLIVTSPSVASQFTQEVSLPKSPVLTKWIRPLADNKDLVSMEGNLWKQWRSVYNPGFSASHLTYLIPHIVEEVEKFCDNLRDRAKAGVVFQLEEATVNLTMDVIGRVVMGTRFNAQKSTHKFVSAFRALIPWYASGTEMNPFNIYNPLRPLIQWYYTRIMDRFIDHELDVRFATYKKTRKQPITIMDLALDKYLETQPESKLHVMDLVFKKFAISQMKVFVLAGHDTTSSTLCYIFYLLASNPQARQKARAEHNEVFGSDISLTSSAIIAAPYLLNQLPFTVAVIKETLRLFPPASSTRYGNPGFSLAANGQLFPTDGCTCWSLHQAMHRDPLYWPQPDTFLPERWLVSKDDPLYPVRGAWRPFEVGPRNCIGQELVMSELKIVMVMTLREFNIEACYEEWDQMKGRTGCRTINIERAYQVLNGTMRPAESMPCKVAVAS